MANQPSREPETPFLNGELFTEIEGETAEAGSSGLVGYELESPFQSAFEAGLETLLEPEADLVEEGFYDEVVDKGEWEVSPTALELEDPFQDELELDQTSFIEPETPEGESTGEDEGSPDEAFPAHLDELEDEGLFPDAEAYDSEAGLLPPGAQPDLVADAWEVAAPGRQPQISELAASEVAQLDDEMEQIAVELESISAQLIPQDHPQEEGQLGSVFSRVGNLFSLGPPSAAADPTVAVPPFGFLKRLLMPTPVLNAVQSANAIRWNQRRHPQTSGVDPDDIRNDLQRYVNMSAVQGAISAFNRANPSAQIAMGTPPIDAVFVEAVHQFQAKCFFETGQIDGLAGESTLDSLGIVVRTGMNAADRSNAGALRRLRRVNVSGETGGEFTANSWFDFMVNPSFLGWRFTSGGTVRGVHLFFMRKLRIAEKALLAQPRFRGMTPVELGRVLGFSARSEEHKGARPRATSASMHTYGLSVDVMYSGNPWVRRSAFTEALRRAALLISGHQITQSTSQEFFHSLGSNPNLSTAQIFDILSQRDQDFRQYLGLHNDPTELRSRLNQRRTAGTPGVFASSTETVDQAVRRWQGDIQQDRANMRANNSPFRTDSRNLRDPHRGFLNLNKDLVVALRDKACLAWGAVDIGPGADGSGDIMHFDARVCGLGARLAAVGGNFPVNRGHPCLPCSPGGSSAAEVMEELEAEDEFYHDRVHSMQKEPLVGEAAWSEVEYEQDGDLSEAAYIEAEWEPGEEAFLGTASFLPEWLTEAVKGGLLTLQAAWSMFSGERDVNKLTNMVFYARNPNLPVGYKIQPHEKELVREWLRIRDEVIKPLLRRLQARAPSAPSPGAEPVRLSSGVLTAVERYRPLVEAAAARYGVDSALIFGMIAAESGGKKDLVAKSGYTGLMQAGKGEAHKQPVHSINAGAEKLRDFRRTMDGVLGGYSLRYDQLQEAEQIRLLALAYNAGPVTVAKALQYAAEAGSPERWLDAVHYKRALLFTGGYSLSQAATSCLKGLSPSERDSRTEEARRVWNQWRLKTRVQAQKTTWRGLDDPLPWPSISANLPPFLVCAIDFKHRNAPRYTAKILAYRDRFQSS